MASAVAIGGVSPARADDLATIRQSHKIRVAIDLGLPPFGMTDDKMAPTGSDVEAAQLLAKDLGVELQIVPATGANRVPFLLTNKVDVIMSSLSVTEDRKKVIDFSIPYGIIQVGIAAPAALTIEKPTDLSGKSVALSRGTGADQDATRTAKTVPDMTVVRYDDDATLITAIASGQQDIVCTAPAQLTDINKRAPGKDMTMKIVLRQNGYAVGLRKNQQELKSWLDDWVMSNLANGKLRDNYQRYHGVALPAEMPK
jgi:polar amino acid transport system substrate-binding protein